MIPDTKVNLHLAFRWTVYKIINITSSIVSLGFFYRIKLLHFVRLFQYKFCMLWFNNSNTSYDKNLNYQNGLDSFLDTFSLLKDSMQIDVCFIIIYHSRKFPEIKVVFEKRGWVVDIASLPYLRKNLCLEQKIKFCKNGHSNLWL